MKRLTPCPPELIPAVIYERDGVMFKKNRLVYVDAARFCVLKTSPWLIVKVPGRTDPYGDMLPKYLPPPVLRRREITA
jgi:hypothetical protein